MIQTITYIQGCSRAYIELYTIHPLDFFLKLHILPVSQVKHWCKLYPWVFMTLHILSVISYTICFWVFYEYNSVCIYKSTIQLIQFKNNYEWTQVDVNYSSTQCIECFRSFSDPLPKTMLKVTGDWYELFENISWFCKLICWFNFTHELFF